MTPGARVSAAIGVLDAVIDGASAERELLRWARGARYAGSKDRATVRDHVFGAIRRLRSSQAVGGPGGRGAMIGLLAQAGDPATLFDGAGHAPAPLSADEFARLANPPSMMRGERLDIPDWLLPEWDRSLAADADGVAMALRHRAPVQLRANLAKTDADGLIDRLSVLGIGAHRVPLSPTAVEIEGDGRALRSTGLVEDGLAELQDAASQAIADLVPSAGRVLDYCAGGGGKTLAIAARSGRSVEAHDADPARMSDLPARAKRAGARVEMVAKPRGPYDAVLCDAPCSGSGAWRRQPEAKWRLTEERLAELTRMQDEILADASRFVGSNGDLVYATCSLLDRENGERIDAFLRRSPGWRVAERRRYTPLDGSDGFFGARLTQREVDR